MIKSLSCNTGRHKKKRTNWRLLEIIRVKLNFFIGIFYRLPYLTAIIGLCVVLYLNVNKLQDIISSANKMGTVAEKILNSENQIRIKRQFITLKKSLKPTWTILSVTLRAWKLKYRRQIMKIKTKITKILQLKKMIKRHYLKC